MRGHLLAGALKISSGNRFVNELVAQIFAVAYMAAERPDLNWVLDDLAAGRSHAPILNPPGYTPRYTSLADLDYLYMGVGDANYVWFQGAVLGRLAVFLAKDQGFPVVIEKLQKAFPAAEQKQEKLEDINRHLESVRPGFLKAAGSAVGPTTIPRIIPSACSAPAKDSGQSSVVVRNDTAEALTIADREGRDVKIPAHSWQSFRVRVGAPLKLPDGTCLTALGEPTLAIIDRH